MDNDPQTTYPPVYHNKMKDNQEKDEKKDEKINNNRKK
jgi:hypothetical protein